MSWETREEEESLMCRNFAGGARGRQFGRRPHLPSLGQCVDVSNLLCNNLSMPRFRWNDWNIEHIGRHGVKQSEAERVVKTGERRRVGEGKYKAIGRGVGDRWMQVIYIFDP